MDEQISEICRRTSIKEYLEARGCQFIKAGRHYKCKCPLPGHPDDTDPSFNTTVLSSGVEVFKCFGCGESGSVISLIHLMENIRKGEVVNRLAKEAGVKLNSVPGIRLEPMPRDVMETFCDEDDFADEVANLVVRLLAEKPTADAVSRISKLYLKMDELCDLGDKRGMAEIRNRIVAVLTAYCEGGKDDKAKRKETCGSGEEQGQGPKDGQGSMPVAQ